MIKTTKTYSTLKVNKSTFNDVKKKIIKSYPKEQRDAAEHYFIHEREFNWNTPIIGINLGEVCLIT